MEMYVYRNLYRITIWTTDAGEGCCSIRPRAAILLVDEKGDEYTAPWLMPKGLAV